MNHSSKNRLGWAVMLSAAVMLAACSNNDDDEAADGGGTTPPPVTGDVPASAQASTTAWTTFANGQTKTETGKPLDLTGVVAPVSESAAPQPI